MPKRRFTIGVLVSVYWLCLAVSIQAQTGETKAGTSTVSGHVTLKGEPAKNVLVYLQPDVLPLSNPDAYLRARTDDNGQFRITGVTAGAYYVYALAPGFISSDMPRMEGRSLNVSEGENIGNIDFELKQGAVIT